MCFRPPTIEQGPVTCPRCGAEVDATADQCPNCGAKATPAPGTVAAPGMPPKIPGVPSTPTAPSAPKPAAPKA